MAPALLYSDLNEAGGRREQRRYSSRGTIATRRRRHADEANLVIGIVAGARRPASGCTRPDVVGAAHVRCVLRVECASAGRRAARSPGRVGEQQRHAARAPARLANTPRLTEAEVAALRRKAGTVFGPETDAVFGDGLYLALLDENRPRQLGATGTYSANWLPDRFFEPRTSLIESPSNGRLPPITPENARLRAARARPRRRPASAAPRT